MRVDQLDTHSKIAAQFFLVQFLPEKTSVDGSEIRRSPVEVGRLPPTPVVPHIAPKQVLQKDRNQGPVGK